MFHQRWVCVLYIHCLLLCFPFVYLKAYFLKWIITFAVSICFWRLTPFNVSPTHEHVFSAWKIPSKLKCWNHGPGNRGCSSLSAFCLFCTFKLTRCPRAVICFRKKARNQPEPEPRHVQANRRAGAICILAQPANRRASWRLSERQGVQWWRREAAYY